MTQKTLCIIKPDAVKAGNDINILKAIKDAGFNLLGYRKVQLSQDQAEQFYAVHAERPFFGELVEFMTSGPVVVVALEKDNAVQAYRDLIGATNPAEAAEGTIRKLYGSSLGENAVHGSDSEENGKNEVSFFFADDQLFV